MGARITEMKKAHYEVHMGLKRVERDFPDQPSAEARAEIEARSHRYVTVVRVRGSGAPVVRAAWTDGERE
jgi:hypothetical protein